MKEMKEEILQQYPGSRKYPSEKPKYKDLTYVGEQDVGNFIFTNKRLLFLRKTTMAKRLGNGAIEGVGVASFLAGLPQGLVITDYIGSQVSSARVKPEEVEKILGDDPESLSISLEDIVRAEAKRAYMMTAYLMVEYKAADGVKALSFVFGTAAKSQKKLAKAILAAKETIS
jgi:hypothetical protein